MRRAEDGEISMERLRCWRIVGNVRRMTDKLQEDLSDFTGEKGAQLLASERENGHGFASVGGLVPMLLGI